MKFLQAVVLSVISTGYVIASNFSEIEFGDALGRGDFETVIRLCERDKSVCEKGTTYVLEKKAPSFIADFIAKTNQANAGTLKELWDKRSNETIGKVLDKVDFPQQVLVDFASSHQAVCRAEAFLTLLNKISKPEDQESVVEKGIEQVANDLTKTSRLLNALKGKTFRSEHLEDLAIQKALGEGVKSERLDLLPKYIFNHAAITPKLYADALIVLAGWWEYDTMRQFLLQNADRYDLQAVKEKEAYANPKPGFHDDIEKALETVEPERVRNPDIRRVQIAKETFEELGHSGVPEMIAELIGSYIIDVPDINKRTKVADEDFGVTSKSTKKRKDIISSPNSTKRSKSKH